MKTVSVFAWIICGALLFYPAGTFAQWSQTSGPKAPQVTVLAKSGLTVYAGIFEKYDRSTLFQSNDNGNTWSLRDVMGPGTRITAFTSIDQNKYLGTDVGVLYSYGDAAFSAVGRTGYVTNFAVIGSKLFMGTLFTGLFRSTDYSGTWTAINNGITGDCDRALAIDGTDLYVAVNDYGYLPVRLYRSTNSGDTWTLLGGNPDTVPWITSMLARNGTIIYGSTSVGVYRSTDKGATWKPAKAAPNGAVYSMDVKGDTIFAGTSHGVYRSIDQGDTWTQCGLPASDVRSILVSGSSIIVGATGEGLLRTTNNGTQWTRLEWGMPITTNVTVLNAAGGIVRAGAVGLHTSTDKGATWNASMLGAAAPTLSALTVSGDTVFAGIGSRSTPGAAVGLYRSIDKGITWQQLGAGAPSQVVTSIVIDGKTIYAGTYGAGVYRSTDGGLTWGAVNNGLTIGTVQALALCNNVLYAGTYRGGVYRSSDKGETWTAVNGNLGWGDVQAFAVIGSDVFAAAYGRGILQLTKTGDAWGEVNTGLWSLYPTSLVAAGTKLFAGFSGSGGVFVSSNLGKEWKVVSEGLSSQVVASLAASDTDLYAGIMYQGVWRRPLAQMTTAVEDEAKTGVPEEFRLQQNYPNPFNPSTTISFGLPERAHVVLKIFDVMGRDVATLAAEDLPAGMYSRHWNAAGCPSGVYFYRLEAGSFSETKRLILLK